MEENSDWKILLEQSSEWICLFWNSTFEIMAFTLAQTLPNDAREKSSVISLTKHTTPIYYLIITNVHVLFVIMITIRPFSEVPM